MTRTVSLAASQRGYDVAVAEARDILGGRVARERLLPGLSAWGRVADYRLFQLKQRPNVQLYPGSRLSAEEVLEFGFQHVCIATGSTWRADGVARQHVVAMPADAAMSVYTPDDLMEGRLPKGKVVIFDDDHYYMGGVLAELCAQNGCAVTLVTPSAFVSDWTANTLEQASIHRRLVSLGVKILLNTGMVAVHAGEVETNCTYTDQRNRIGCDAVVMVASRLSNDAAYHALKAREADWADAGIRSVKVIGDAAAPAPIAWATFAGHRYARELDAPEWGDALPFRREVTRLED
jgi:dimethylamine/trimethylamine dehydrogenase